MAKNPDPLGIKKAARPGHGGPRSGAGRPPVKTTQRSKKVANEIAEGTRDLTEPEGELPPGATPLDVMMMAMRKAFKVGGSLAAAPYAEKCAPYIHARLANIQQTGKDNGPIVLQFTWASDSED